MSKLTELIAVPEGAVAVKKLLGTQKGKDQLNVLDEDGFSPLQRTAHKGYTTIATILIRNGADTTLKSADGKTALDVASGCGHDEVAMLLKEHANKCNKVLSDAKSGMWASPPNETADEHAPSVMAAIIECCTAAAAAEPPKTGGSTWWYQEAALRADAANVVSLSAEVQAARAKWFWNGTGREEAVDALEGKDEGTFLVRTSASDSETFTISVVQEGVAKHVRVEVTNGTNPGEKGYRINKSDDPCASLEELIVQKQGETITSKVAGGTAVETKLLQTPLPDKRITRLAIGDEVTLTDDHSLYEDASDGPLSPGDVGVIVTDDHSSKPFNVTFDGALPGNADDALSTILCSWTQPITKTALVAMLSMPKENLQMLKDRGVNFTSLADDSGMNVMDSAVQKLQTDDSKRNRDVFALLLSWKVYGTKITTTKEGLFLSAAKSGDTALMTKLKEAPHNCDVQAISQTIDDSGMNVMDSAVQELQTDDSKRNRDVFALLLSWKVYGTKITTTKEGLFLSAARSGDTAFMTKLKEAPHNCDIHATTTAGDSIDSIQGSPLSAEVQAARAKWFWNGIGRGEAVDALEGKDEGTFLVRTSASDSETFTITVVQEGIAKHLRVKVTNGTNPGDKGYRVNDAFDPCASLEELIVQMQGETLKSRKAGGGGTAVETKLLQTPLPDKRSFSSAGNYGLNAMDYAVQTGETESRNLLLSWEVYGTTATTTKEGLFLSAANSGDTTLMTTLKEPPHNCNIQAVGKGVGIEIAGITGGKISRVNGVYAETEIIVHGKPVFQNVSSPTANLTLYFAKSQKWMVGATSDVKEGADTGCAHSVDVGLATPILCSGEQWKVYDRSWKVVSCITVTATGGLNAMDSAIRAVVDAGTKTAAKSVEAKENAEIQAARAKWFWDDIGKDEAESALEGKDEGTFLVRCSMKDGGEFTISVVKAHGHRAISHIRIKTSQSDFGDTRYCLDTNDVPCSTLEELIAEKQGEIMTSGNTHTEKTSASLLVTPLPDKRGLKRSPTVSLLLDWGALDTEFQLAKTILAWDLASFGADATVEYLYRATVGMDAAANSKLTDSQRPGDEIFKECFANLAKLQSLQLDLAWEICQRASILYLNQNVVEAAKVTDELKAMLIEHAGGKGNQARYRETCGDVMLQPKYPSYVNKLSGIESRVNKQSNGKKPTQSTSDMKSLYQNAQAVVERFVKLVTVVGEKTNNDVVLPTVLKNPFRSMQKAMKSASTGSDPTGIRSDTVDASTCKDIVRGLAQMPDLGKGSAILDLLMGCDVNEAHHNTGGSSASAGVDEKIVIVWVKNRWTTPTNGGWADTLLNFYFADDETKTICELQLAHADMMSIREKFGGHNGYDELRKAVELLTITDHADIVAAVEASTKAAAPVVLKLQPEAENTIASSEPTSNAALQQCLDAIRRMEDEVASVKSANKALSAEVALVKSENAILSAKVEQLENQSPDDPERFGGFDDGVGQAEASAEDAGDDDGEMFGGFDNGVRGQTETSTDVVALLTEDIGSLKGRIDTLEATSANTSAFTNLELEVHGMASRLAWLEASPINSTARNAGFGGGKKAVKKVNPKTSKSKEGGLDL